VAARDVIAGPAPDGATGVLAAEGDTAAGICHGATVRAWDSVDTASPSGTSTGMTVPESFARGSAAFGGGGDLSVGAPEASEQLAINFTAMGCGL